MMKCIQYRIVAACFKLCSLYAFKHDQNMIRSFHMYFIEFIQCGNSNLTKSKATFLRFYINIKSLRKIKVSIKQIWKQINERAKKALNIITLTVQVSVFLECLFDIFRTYFLIFFILKFAKWIIPAYV